MSPLLFLYLLLGPAAYVGLLVLGMFAGKRMSRLARSKSQLPDPAPSLSLVIPAKDEAAGIEDCVRRALQQDYPAFDVVVIDDRSGDGTGEVLDRFAENAERGTRNAEQQRDSKATALSPSVPHSTFLVPRSRPSSLRVVHVTSLPPGWLGKCHALHVGTRDLASDWLLFVDSDVTLSSDAARRGVALCEERKWDALSIMPTLQAQSYWERTLLPMLAVAWSAAFAISLTNDDSKPRRAVANGQFFLVRRDWYERVGGHAGVRDQIVEDVMLMRTLKAAGAKVRLQMGQDLARARMHATLHQIYHGWARIFAGTSGRSVWPMVGILAFVVLSTLSVLPALAAGTRSTPWLVAGLAHLALIVAFTAKVYRTTRVGLYNVLLLPVTIPMLMAVVVYAIRVCSSGAVIWRGASVAVNRAEKSPQLNADAGG